jgi:glycosyltransferase involved in cell wall biosynthesis
MRILLMADMPADPNSGAAGTEYLTIKALGTLGHEVDAIWSDGLPRRIRHGNIHYLLELPFAYEHRMLERLRSADYDVVHVNQPHGYRAARTLARLNRRTVFIHRSHGFELRVERDLKPWKERYDKDNRLFLKRLASRALTDALSYNCRSIARHADGHIVYASQCGQFLQEELGVRKEQIAVIPAASPNAFVESPAPTMTSERLKRVLYVSQFAFFKAPMIVAAVMNHLSETDSDLEFTWVCSKQHHADVRALLSENVRTRVNLLDWKCQDELMHAYDAHGIFLFPSFFEGFGKVFLEAMSRGLCVVAADNSGAHDVISNGEDGILVPTGSVDSMVNSCLRLLGDAELASSISRAAAKTARSYTWDRVARETVAFYEDRIAAKATRSK